MPDKLLTLSYDGADFYGWQRQREHRTVQAVLEEAIQRVTGESLRVVAAGRTDTGVHALGQAVSFSTVSSLDNSTLLRAINAYLPRDVVALELTETVPGFNAIERARGKRYRYLVHDGPQRDVFVRRYAWRVWQPLDLAAMQTAALGLLGTHDFSSYENAGSPRVSSVRTVRELIVDRSRFGASELIACEIEADGFLYNMVRNIVGTLVDVGKGKHPASWPAAVLGARDRSLAGMCAPPHGLFLVKVYY